MKKLGYILMVGLMSAALLATANNGKPKPVISNYAEVLKQIEYPTVCRENGVEGTVFVRISVDNEGNMTKYDIVKTPCSDLKEAVEKVLPLLTFQPANVEGQNVSSKILIPIEFRLTY